MNRRRTSIPVLLCFEFCQLCLAPSMLAETVPKQRPRTHECFDCEFDPGLVVPPPKRSSFQPRRPTASARPTSFVPPCGFTYGISYATRDVACTVDKFVCVRSISALTCLGRVLLQNPSTAVVVSNHVTISRQGDDVDLDFTPTWPDTNSSAVDRAAEDRVLQVLSASREGHLVNIGPLHLPLQQDITPACEVPAARFNDAYVSYLPKESWIVRVSVGYLPRRLIRKACFGDCVLPEMRVCRSALVHTPGRGQ